MVGLLPSLYSPPLHPRLSRPQPATSSALHNPWDPYIHYKVYKHLPMTTNRPTIRPLDAYNNYRLPQHQPRAPNHHSQFNSYKLALNQPKDKFIFPSTQTNKKLSNIKAFYFLLPNISYSQWTPLKSANKQGEESYLENLKPELIPYPKTQTPNTLLYQSPGTSLNPITKEPRTSFHGLEDLRNEGYGSPLAPVVRVLHTTDHRDHDKPQDSARHGLGAGVLPSAQVSRHKYHRKQVKYYTSFIPAETTGKKKAISHKEIFMPSPREDIYYIPHSTFQPQEEYGFPTPHPTHPLRCPLGQANSSCGSVEEHWSLETPRLDASGRTILANTLHTSDITLTTPRSTKGTPTQKPNSVQYPVIPKIPQEKHTLLSFPFDHVVHSTLPSPLDIRPETQAKSTAKPENLVNVSSFTTSTKEEPTPAFTTSSLRPTSAK